MGALINRSNEKCPFCSKESRVRFSARDWNQHSSEELFVYRECSECALIFIAPFPDDPGKYYVHEQYDIPTSAEGFDARAESQAWKLALIKPFVTAGNMLEIGPATGEFATVARRAGYSPKLVEMDEECCAFLRNHLKHDVIQSNRPADCLDEKEMFDIICVWQAIEHIPEFWTVIAKAARQLRPGGVLALSTPNPHSLQARLMGRYWPHADAPRHLYLIPPSWFERACGAWGLRIEVLTTTDEGSIGPNYYGWYLWVRNRAGRLLSPQRVQACAALLTSIFRRWETRERQGCSYTAIMIKETDPRSSGG